MITYIAFALFIILLIYFFSITSKKRKWIKPVEGISSNYKNILEEQVTFYRNLNAEEKRTFEYEIQEFLANYKITPINTLLSDTERVLVAASGVIPTFAFPDWTYVNLTEILIYPDTFNLDFETEGGARDVLGMVGTGTMQNKMILSKKAILNGFATDRDGQNTAIHEFVHLIDGLDGEIDGLPKVLLEEPYLIPWFELIRKEMQRISREDSVLRPYGAYNAAEFFAVASEYFFEKPKKLKRIHPELYAFMTEVFSRK